MTQFMWEKLGEEKSSQELLSEVLKEYDIDEKTALEDMNAFIKKLEELDILED